ncbi:Single-stranded-DNA-specific exonuclease RecJ [bacterium HR25]|nr:Single-stranded-DNA-specific exonuclease RecJ [bacterium HR25]
MRRGLRGQRWQLRPPPPPNALAESPYPPLIRQLLWHRGVASVAEAERFFAQTPTEHDPFLLPEIGRALACLRRAILEGEAVAVFGDFDVDGVTAAALLTETLRDLGATAVPYIPDRFSEGYGLNIPALQMLAEAGVRTLVAVDCGTTALAEVAEARRLGMEVVVLDHHTVLDSLPGAVATVNPKRSDSRYPQPELASVGLAYKLAAALYDSLARPFPDHIYLDLVALGTVTDLVPLVDENRWLLQRGLRALRRTERPGLRALIEESGLAGREVDVWAIGWVLGPRLNAAGRLAHARQALELLLTRDEGEARRLALELCRLNQERQRQTEAALALAQEMVASEGPAPLIFVGHPDIPAGIVGLVASRLAEEHYRPAIVCEVGPQFSRGSGRSIPEFDIVAALRSCGDLFVKYGGHRQAAGFTARSERLDEIRDLLRERAARELAGVELVPLLEIDLPLPLRSLRGELVRWLERFHPFGPGNPEPAFLARGVSVVDVRPAGDGGRHLRLKLRDGPVVWPGTAFGLGDAPLRPGETVDVVYSLARDRAREGLLELRIKDIAPAEPGLLPS